MSQPYTDRNSRDFFISYTGADEQWARWIAVQLEHAGYTTFIQAFDIAPGSDFVHEMHVETSKSSRTIVVLSPSYLLGSEMGESEWRVAFRSDPTGERGTLVPVLVLPCQPPGLLSTRVFIDLVDTDEATARRRLVEGVGRRGQRPSGSPFPGHKRAAASTDGTPAFPGSRPTATQEPRLGTKPRIQTLWNGRLAEALDTMKKLERVGPIDVGALVAQSPFDENVMRMARHLVAQDPAGTAPFLLGLIRDTPVTGAGWQAARYASHLLTPAHREYVADELFGFLDGHVERQRMAMVALGSCGAHYASATIVERALRDPGKLAGFGASGLASLLLACPANRLQTAGTSIIDGLQELLSADSHALPAASDLNYLPPSHAHLLADRWLSTSDGTQLGCAADALGNARAIRARQQLADRAVQVPEHAGRLLRGLALIGGPEAVELLEARMSSPALNEAAAEALCLCVRDASGSRVHDLIDLLLGDNLKNRWLIYLAIGIHDDTAFIELLVDALDSGSAPERGAAALGLAEFRRSSMRPRIEAAFEQASEPIEIMLAGLAALRLGTSMDVVPRLDKAMIALSVWAHVPAIFDHAVAVLRDAGGSYGQQTAPALTWLRSAALPAQGRLSGESSV